MKRIISLLILLAMLSSCAYGKEKVERLLIDSDYAEYEQRKDELEQAYIKGEISYIEYQNSMDELNQDRISSDKKKEDIVIGQER